MSPLWLLLLAPAAVPFSSADADADADVDAQAAILAAVATEANVTKKLSECSGIAGGEDAFTCDEYLEIIGSGYGQKIEAALACIGYNKYESPAFIIQKYDLTAFYGPIHYIYVIVDFKKVIALDTEMSTMHLDFLTYLSWPEPRFQMLLAETYYKEKEDDKCYNSEIAYELDSHVSDHLWAPPVQLDNMVTMELKNSFRSGKGLRLYEDGILELYGRYDAKIACDFDFGMFPFDEQSCDFRLYLEFGNKTVVALRWSEDWHFLTVTNASELHIPDWDLELTEGPNFEFDNVYNLQLTEGISAKFRFTRLYTIHLLHTFFPSIMISVSSIVSVFVPSDLVPGRMGLVITAFLSMISLFNGARKDWPPTSYMKAIDVWSTGCYFTVFSALVEYCIVLFLVKKAEWERKVLKHFKAEAKKKSKISPLDRLDVQPKVYDQHGELIRKKEVLASKIEMSGRVLLPTYFILFNLIFWIAVSV